MLLVNTYRMASKVMHFGHIKLSSQLLVLQINEWIGEIIILTSRPCIVYENIIAEIKGCEFHRMGGLLCIEHMRTFVISTKYYKDFGRVCYFMVHGRLIMLAKGAFTRRISASRVITSVMLFKLNSIISC